MFRRKKALTVIGIIVFCVFISGVLISRNRMVPILMYHSVNPVQNPKIRGLIVSPEGFRKQMRFLKERRYNVVSLEALVDMISLGKKIPPKTVAITFDDGYKDNYQYAFPVLKEYRLPATFFIIVNEVSRRQNDRLSWRELMIMRDSGIVSFGSHCLKPEPLVNVKPEDALRQEIFDSRKILEEKLGVSVLLFSYPEGFFNQHIKDLVKAAGYKAAVATKSRRSNRIKNNDIFALKRLRISSSCDNLIVFWFKLTGFYSFFKENRK